ncbi:hypothetical protein [Clostridium niameyense]|uniref:hypothetical protein n=1 Tax=Clostridium niameyense TaxID=1622073 RepID=UPI00067E951A|nr:hypothetical protein [Clostridium niameyense]
MSNSDSSKNIKEKKICFKEKIPKEKFKSKSTDFKILNSEKENLKNSIISFEGGKDFSNIPDLKTDVSTIKFPGWILLLEHNKNGCGNIDNIPIIATWTKHKNYPDNYRYILFDNEISKISLDYTSYFPIKIIICDKNNKILKTLNGEKTWNENDGYNKVSTIDFDANKNIIKYLKIESFADYIGINNLQISKNLKEDSKNTNSNQNNMANKLDLDRLFLALAIYLLFFHKNSR